MWFGKSCFQLGKLFLQKNWRKNTNKININRIGVLVYLPAQQTAHKIFRTRTESDFSEIRKYFCRLTPFSFFEICK